MVKTEKSSEGFVCNQNVIINWFEASHLNILDFKIGTTAQF